MHNRKCLIIFSDNHPIALNESAPHRDLAEGASIDTGDTADTSGSGQEVGENGEPAAKRHKLDVVVPEDYVSCLGGNIPSQKRSSIATGRKSGLERIIF